jgi:Aspartyl protease
VRTVAIGASLLATLAVIVGCGTSAQHTAAMQAAAHASTGAVVTPSGRHLSKLSTTGTPKGEQMIKIEVVATSTKPTRQTLALVPVFIDGHGPLPFALDTGASRSLISATLAQRLGLPRHGSAGMLQGVTGAASAENFAVASWRAGPVALPRSLIAAIGSPSPSAGASGALRGPVGLLGSDVLSRYGKIAIDYDKGLLVLDPPVK